MPISIITAAAGLYCISYCAYAASKKRTLGALGALILGVAGICTSVFLWLYIL